MRTRFGSVAINSARQRDGYTVFRVPNEWTNAHSVPVCCANFFPEMFELSDNVLFGQCADNNDSVAPLQGVMFFACVAIPQGARFWFRRLKFIHATVSTLTIRNCCRKCRVGACSHSVRKVCVCVCRSMHAKCGCQGSVTYSENCFSHKYIYGIRNVTS